MGLRGIVGEKEEEGEGGGEGSKRGKSGREFGTPSRLSELAHSTLEAIDVDL